MNQRDGKELQRTQVISHHKKNLSVEQSKIQLKIQIGQKTPYKTMKMLKLLTLASNLSQKFLKSDAQIAKLPSPEQFRRP